MLDGKLTTDIHSFNPADGIRGILGSLAVPNKGQIDSPCGTKRSSDTMFWDDLGFMTILLIVPSLSSERRN